MTPQVKAGIKRAAVDDSRSQASMVEKILRGWLQQNGYLAVPKKREAEIARFKTERAEARKQ